MDCPECGGETSVVETVPYPDRVRRRRECQKCGERFTTKEASLLDVFRLEKARKEMRTAVDSLMKVRPLVESLGVADGSDDVDSALLKVRQVRRRLEDREREVRDAG